MSAPRAAEKSLVNVSLPLSSMIRRSFLSPGSKNGGLPRDSESTLAWSTSMPTTWWPRSAMHTACVVPRYPVPMTDRERPAGPDPFEDGPEPFPDGWAPFADGPAAVAATSARAGTTDDGGTDGAT